MPALCIALELDPAFRTIGNCELRYPFHFEAEKGFDIGVFTTQQRDGADEQELASEDTSQQRQSSDHASPPASQAEYSVRRLVMRLR